MHGRCKLSRLTCCSAAGPKVLAHWRGAGGPSAATKGRAPWSSVTGFGMQFQPQRVDDFEDGVKVRAAFSGEGLI